MDFRENYICLFVLLKCGSFFTTIRARKKLFLRATDYVNM